MAKARKPRTIIWVSVPLTEGEYEIFRSEACRTGPGTVAAAIRKAISTTSHARKKIWGCSGQLHEVPYGFTNRVDKTEVEYFEEKELREGQLLGTNPEDLSYPGEF